jgi:hypothetical protein
MHTSAHGSVTLLLNPRTQDNTSMHTSAHGSVTLLLNPRTPMAVKLSAKLCLALPMPCRHREPAHCANGYTGAGFFFAGSRSCATGRLSPVQLPPLNPHSLRNR